MGGDILVYKITVIIPCHNSELTLKSCIDSVINQSIGFENIELILYDNASSDSTRKIIQNYAKKFSNICPFYSDIDSGFPGTGRNKGIEVASSKYVMFMDSDDEYDSCICEKLYNTIINENADLVCCNKLVIDGNAEINSHVSDVDKNEKIIITGEDIVYFKDIAVWNKIFKKEIIYKNNLKFLENTSADDFAFSVSYFLKSKKLVYLKYYYGYVWKIYSDSLSHTVTKEYITELIGAYYYIYETLKKENKEELMDNVIKKHIINLLIHASRLNLNNAEFKDVLNEILNFEININFSTKLDEKIFDIINFFILHKKFNSAILCLKFLGKLRNITSLQKIYSLFNKVDS